MKERIKEIITYIMDQRIDGFIDAEDMHFELEDMGYTEDEIKQAFSILDFDHSFDEVEPDTAFHTRNRILGEGEKMFLTIDAQGYLIRLQSSGWLTETQLSLIIENAGIEYPIPVSLGEIKELTSRYVPEIPDDILSGSDKPSDRLN